MVFSGILLAILGLLVSLAGPASAAQGFTIETAAGAAPADGSARVVGEVTFPTRSKFRVSGRINDQCPGDGYGAYLYVIGAYSNGDSISSTPRLVATDTHGCTASSVGYAFDEPFTPNANRTVAWVRLSLYEYNSDNGAYGNVASSQYFHNPRA